MSRVLWVTYSDIISLQQLLFLIQLRIFLILVLCKAHYVFFPLYSTYNNNVTDYSLFLSEKYFFKLWNLFIIFSLYCFVIIFVCSTANVFQAQYSERRWIYGTNSHDTPGAGILIMGFNHKCCLIDILPPADHMSMVVHRACHVYHVTNYSTLITILATIIVVYINTVRTFFRHDLVNHPTDFLNNNISRKLMIRCWWRSSLLD